MDFNDTQTVWIAYAASNIAGLVFLFAARKNTRLARLLFALLFAWACWINYNTAHSQPVIYLNYSARAVPLYRHFIDGWFSRNITVFVSTIAVAQGCIAIGMLLKGIFVKLACLGTIIFLLAIAPLGVYAAFPFSLTVGLAAFWVWKKDKKDFLWKK